MKKDFSSIKRATATFVIFMSFTFTNFLPILINREAYLQNMLEHNYKQEYIDAFSVYVPSWSVFPITIGGMLGGLLGCIIGVKMLKKHFKKANMI